MGQKFGMIPTGLPGNHEFTAAERNLLPVNGIPIKGDRGETPPAIAKHANLTVNAQGPIEPIPKAQHCTNSDLKDSESIKAESRRRYFHPRPKDREGRIKVNIKDLKPKRIKDYLECKISQRSPALLKYLLFNDS
ncbi:hypothetical protein GQ457_10G009970 [Hibiscus cannabinus]